MNMMNVDDAHNIGNMKPFHHILVAYIVVVVFIYDGRWKFISLSFSLFSISFRLCLCIASMKPTSGSSYTAYIFFSPSLLENESLESMQIIFISIFLHFSSSLFDGNCVFVCMELIFYEIDSVAIKKRSLKNIIIFLRTLLLFLYFIFFSYFFSLPFSPIIRCNWINSIATVYIYVCIKHKRWVIQCFYFALALFSSSVFRSFFYSFHSFYSWLFSYYIFVLNSIVFAFCLGFIFFFFLCINYLEKEK